MTVFTSPSKIKFVKSLFFTQRLKARKLFLSLSFFVSLDDKKGPRAKAKMFLSNTSQPEVKDFPL